MADEVVKISGSYRQIEAKIQRILLGRQDDTSFFVVEIEDKSGIRKRYSGLTDIMNFLKELRTVLIPIEDAENSKGSYGFVNIFGGNRY
ncbi:MAG: hypothetical protein FWB90_02880 [Fibromonadales bacterium]|nr:hypothetical protein [Fibromonadales bacterium]